MQDKIAEHIAKFNAPEGSDFFWVSNNYDILHKHIKKCDTGFLMLKLDDDHLKWINEDGAYGVCGNGWNYTLKHEQKGEQMKSIELSERDLVNVKLMLGHYLVTCDEQNEARIRFNIALENAKPIPTEPRFSLDEIREKLESWSWGLAIIDRVIESLKPPKPRLRDRTFKEVLIWLSEQENCEDYLFKRNETSACNCDIILAKVYAKDEFSPWLPIPQIEIESEKK